MINKQIIPLIGMSILMGIFYISNDKMVELVKGIPLIIILVWSMISTYKSNIDSKLKRYSLISIVVILSIFGRLYFQLMN
jgi:hypothetical protein